MWGGNIVHECRFPHFMVGLISRSVNCWYIIDSAGFCDFMSCFFSQAVITTYLGFILTFWKYHSLFFCWEYQNVSRSMANASEQKHGLWLNSTLVYMCLMIWIEGNKVKIYWYCSEFCGYQFLSWENSKLFVLANTGTQEK